MSDYPDWVPTAGGLLLPGAYGETLRKSRAEDEKQQRGRFFSEYASLLGMSPSSYTAEKPAATAPFALLRQTAKQSIIDRLLIDLRKHQIKRLARVCYVPGRELGFRIVHKRYNDPSFDMTDTITKRCREVQERIAQGVNPAVHATLRDFWTIAVEEELSIDRKAMVIFRDRKGLPVRFHLLDGATIKPALAVITQYMRQQHENDYAQAAERLSEEVGVNIADAAWAQVVNGRVVAAWRAEEMSVDITDPTIELDLVLYGRSIVERSLRLTNSFLNTWNFNDEAFRQQMPDGFLILYGDFDPQGQSDFKRQMYGDQVAGGRARVPVLTAGPENEGFKGEFVKVRETPREAQFMQWLNLVIRLKCACFRAHPSSINVDAEPKNDGIVFTAQDNDELQLAQEEGFGSLVDSLCEWQSRALVQQIDPDLVMIPEGLNRLPEAQRVELRTQELSYHTINEVRAKEDLEPLPNKVPEQPGDFIPSPAMMQVYQMIQQGDLMKQQQDMMASGSMDTEGNPTQPLQPPVATGQPGGAQPMPGPGGGSPAGGPPQEQP